MSNLFKLERDTIAGLGLLSATYLRFDPELLSGPNISHAKGYNVVCIVVDNQDGEVYAVQKNQIHQDNNPLQHAEQVGIRAAMQKIHRKRHRGSNLTLDSARQTLKPPPSIFRQFFFGADDDPNVITSLNRSVHEQLQPQSAVWKNYDLKGAIWLNHPERIS